MTSSPVTAAHVDPPLLRAANLVQLLPFLPDPRDPRGLRHRLVSLTLTIAAVVGGARSITAIWVLSLTTTRSARRIRAMGGPQPPS